MDDERERYFDFSTDSDDSDEFQGEASDNAFMYSYMEKTQRYIRYRNPVISIRQLIAYNGGMRFAQTRASQKQRTTTNLLLGVIAGLLAYIAFTVT